jgi:glyoxylase-like metal-dependent hydrolase (beta-lactamase superfamily II)
MKNVSVLSTILAVLLCSLHSSGQPAQPKLTITHLTGDFYVYTTYNLYGKEYVPSNSMYLVTNKGVVMFDTPWDTTQCQPLLDSIQQRHHQQVVLSISTHFHEDRTGGLTFLQSKGVKTWSSFQTLELCKQRGEQQAAFYFTKDTTFNIGNHRFQTYYPGAGHAPDNILIWFDKEKVLYGGCFIKSTEAASLGNLSDANPAAWLINVEKVMKAFPHPQYVIPGHQDWHNNQSLPYTLKLLKEHATKKQ